MSEELEKREVINKSKYQNTIIQNIAYCEDGIYEHMLDIIYPNQKMAKYPFIVNVHGGGFSINSKDYLYREYALRLAQNKYAVVNVNYRLSVHHKFPAQLEDMLQLLTFLENYAHEYELDINNMFLCGDSAGGYLVAMTTCILTNPLLRTYYKCGVKIMPRAIACNCGLFDFKTMIGNDIVFPLKRGIVFELFGTTKFYELEVFEYSSVLKFVTKDFCPTYILDTARFSFENEAKRLMKVLRKNRIPFYAHIYPLKYNLDHVFNLKAKYPQSKIVLNEMLAYFDKHRFEVK